MLGLACAVLLTQRFPLRGLVRALAFLPWAVPGLVAALGWRWLFDEQAGVFNAVLLMTGMHDRPSLAVRPADRALVSIGIATVWQGLPFFMLMFIAGADDSAGRDSTKPRRSTARRRGRGFPGISPCRPSPTSSR